MIRLKVSNLTPVTFRVRDNRERVSLSVGKAKEVLVGGSGGIYDGPYTVEPTFNKQSLMTKNKTLYNDVTVNPIRIERTSNSHGTTVYIGTKGD